MNILSVILYYMINTIKSGKFQNFHKRKKVNCQFWFEITSTVEFEDQGSFQEYSLRIYATPPPFKGEFYESTLKSISEEGAKSTMMDAHGQPQYLGIGLPETALRIASHVLKMNILSSRNKSAPEGEFRTEKATKVWERLREELPSRVTYNLEEDYYILTYDQDDQLEYSN